MEFLELYISHTHTQTKQISRVSTFWQIARAMFSPSPFTTVSGPIFGTWVRNAWKGLHGLSQITRGCFYPILVMSCSKPPSLLQRNYLGTSLHSQASTERSCGDSCLIMGCRTILGVKMVSNPVLFWSGFYRYSTVGSTEQLVLFFHCQLFVHPSSVHTHTPRSFSAAIVSSFPLSFTPLFQ